MFCYDRIDLKKKIDVTEINNRNYYIICHYQDSVCNSCHELTVKGVDYRCIINDISKSKEINL